MIDTLTPAARLRRRVDAWTVRLQVAPRIVRIQPMSRKWGSCSTAGTISLALDLDAQDPGFQDFVIVHELLHLKVPNHGRLFRALMSVHVPGWRVHDVARRTGAMALRPADQRSSVIVPNQHSGGGRSRNEQE